MGTPAETTYEYNEPSGGEVQGIEPTGSNSPGPNPAWNDVLNVLPSQFHGIVTPHFQQWDQAANQRIEGIKSQYADYQPFVEHGISQQDLIQGLRLMQQLNENPREVYDALVAAYKYDQQQEQQQTQEIQQEQQQNFNDPRVDHLQQGVDLMARIMYEQEQQRTNAAADSALDAELNSLRQKYGDYDETYVLSHMRSGATGEQAVQAFMTLKNSLLTNNPRPFAPSVLGNHSGNGAGIPSGAIDPTKLSSKETRNLVAEMLRSASQQN